MQVQHPLARLCAHFDAVVPHLEQAFKGDPQKIEQVRQTARKLREDAQRGTLRTVVFGHYNAGKSTFINALLGQARAPMADVPLTAHIEDYEWQGHVLTDSPGIDAPIEHEQLTDDYIEHECNAVVYVIATGVGIEEAATWERLCRFVKQKKAVVIVVNDKNGHTLNGLEFLRLRQTVYANMQAAAKRHGLDGPLERIEVLHVKAASALKAKLEGKAALLRASGITEAEDFLRRFLSDSTHKILLSDRERARVLVNEALARLGGRDGHEPGRLLADCRAAVDNEKVRLVGALADTARMLVARETQELQEVVSRINMRNADVEALLSKAFERSQSRLGTGIEKSLQHELERSAATVRQAARQLNDKLTVGQVRAPGVELKSTMFPGVGSADGDASRGESFTAGDVLEKMKTMPVGELTESGVKTLLKYGKEIFPDLFKGIGPKTMGKWAAGAGKAAGPLLALATSAYELWQASEDEKRAREEHRQFIAGVMSAVRKTFADALEDYDVAFRKIAASAFDPFIECLDRHACALNTADAQSEKLRARLAAWSSGLEA